MTSQNFRLRSVLGLLLLAFTATGCGATTSRQTAITPLPRQAAGPPPPQPPQPSHGMHRPWSPFAGLVYGPGLNAGNTNRLARPN